MRGRSLLMLVASSACLLRNPDFGADSDATADTPTATTAATTGTASGSGDASTLPGTGGATTGSGTDGGSASATSAASATTGIGTSGEATTGDGTTAPGVPPGTYEIQPTVAACVLLPYGAPHAGPSVCSANATQQNGTALTGLLMIDTSVMSLDGMGRPAHTYLRFDVPAEFSGATIVSATLTLQVADGPDDYPNGPQSGVLILTEAFDAASLESSAPQLQVTLADDKGFVGTNEVVTWSLDLPFVQPGQPLYLGLLPTDDDGVFYRGATNPGAPVLTLVVQ